MRNVYSAAQKPKTTCGTDGIATGTTRFFGGGLRFRREPSFSAGPGAFDGTGRGAEFDRLLKVLWRDDVHVMTDVRMMSTLTCEEGSSFLFDEVQPIVHA
jgi:hypothetical protein